VSPNLWILERTVGDGASVGVAVNAFMPQSDCNMSPMATCTHASGAEISSASRNNAPAFAIRLGAITAFGSVVRKPVKRCYIL
jgi:hypothetical protein